MGGWYVSKRAMFYSCQSCAAEIVIHHGAPCGAPIICPCCRRGMVSIGPSGRMAFTNDEHVKMTLEKVEKIEVTPI